MDPNLFHLDWDRTFEALAGVIVLSFLVERVAALLFESKAFVLNTKVPEEGSPQEGVELVTATQAKEILDATAVLASSNGSTDKAETTRAAAAKKLSKTAAALSPSSPLWPIETSNPNGARTRAVRAMEVLEKRQDRRRTFGSLPIKEAGAFALAAAIVAPLQFDAFAIVLLAEKTSLLGALGTAAVIAGGSKASIKLFRDVLGAQSNTMDAVRKPKEPSR